MLRINEHSERASNDGLILKYRNYQVPLSDICISLQLRAQMIFPGNNPESSQMAYNPFLLHRPSDYSGMNQLIAQANYLPGLAGFQHPGLASSILPKLQQSMGRGPITPADLLGYRHLQPLRSLEPPESEVQDDPKVELEGKDLWEQFNNLGTEMVITKSGR